MGCKCENIPKDPVSKGKKSFLLSEKEYITDRNQS